MQKSKNQLNTSIRKYWNLSIVQKQPLAHVLQNRCTFNIEKYFKILRNFFYRTPPAATSVKARLVILIMVQIRYFFIECFSLTLNWLLQLSRRRSISEYFFSQRKENYYYSKCLPGFQTNISFYNLVVNVNSIHIKSKVV